MKVLKSWRRVFMGMFLKKKIPNYDIKTHSKEKGVSFGIRVNLTEKFDRRVKQLGRYQSFNRNCMWSV